MMQLYIFSFLQTYQGCGLDASNVSTKNYNISVLSQLFVSRAQRHMKTSHTRRTLLFFTDYSMNNYKHYFNWL